MIIAAGEFTVAPEYHDAMVAAIQTVTAATREEEGCLEYEFWADLAARGRFHVFEVWETAGHLEAHTATPHLLAFRAARVEMEMLDFDLKRYEVGEVKGL